VNPLDLLIARLMRARKWPLPGEDQIRARLALWIALREADEPAIRRLMKWPRDRPLILDNLPEKIASAYGDLLFGQEPAWTPADQADAQPLDDLVDTWPGELPAAEETCVSEGEVWWRLSTAPGVDHPVLSWHSRWDVVPLLHGRFVLAAAFVSQLESPQRGEVWRHLEIHGDGEVRNMLFRGRATALGQSVDLGRHPETANLAPVWRHDLPGMLCGRIVNRWGRRPTAGVSIYAGTWTRFLALNEAATIGRENMRLTAKKRAVVPASALRPRIPRPGDLTIQAGEDLGDGSFEALPLPARPTFDAGEDVLVHDPLDADEGGSGTPPFRVLEYSFDAESLIAYETHLVETTCQRCDLVPQIIGNGDFGHGNTGIALRVRLLPTTNAADSRGRPWDEEMPRIAVMAQMLEAMPVALGGIGRDSWTNAGGVPGFARADPLPHDDNEVATRHSTLKTADLISIETSLRERYPQWDDQQIGDEVDRIRSDVSASVPAATFGGGAA
jgi:hypothetical protein